MKKKIGLFIGTIAIIIFVIIVVMIFNNGTNTGTTKADIIKRNGEAEQLSANELKNIYKENQATFENNYQGAEISFVGTVSKVEYDFLENMGSTRITMDAITFKEGYKVYLLHDSYDMTEFNKDDRVYVSTNIYSVSSTPIDLRGTGGSKGFNETSLKTTIIKNVTEKSDEEISKIKEIITEKKDLYSSLEVAEDKLQFISNYAGNVNNNGSRKFSDEILNEFNTCLEKEYNYDLIENDIPGIKNQIETIKTANKSIYDMLVEMGNTNSDKNVSKIKTDAKNNLKAVQELMKKLK